ncbi:ras gtpase-activating protein [Anaeramoeba ignava]|uniref:Ras gtpase-activating protein n=1 Tax=Anaeramoeba ignava TaxID=1746090 RepID=A0A9Q0R5H5_ANAIG|nr:ras gtpase-activating protein [Anaeramoeba ignava]
MQEKQENEENQEKKENQEKPKTQVQKVKIYRLQKSRSTISHRPQFLSQEEISETRTQLQTTLFFGSFSNDQPKDHFQIPKTKKAHFRNSSDDLRLPKTRSLNRVTFEDEEPEIKPNSNKLKNKIRDLKDFRKNRIERKPQMTIFQPTTEIGRMEKSPSFGTIQYEERGINDISLNDLKSPISPRAFDITSFTQENQKIKKKKIKKKKNKFSITVSNEQLYEMFDENLEIVDKMEPLTLRLNNVDLFAESLLRIYESKSLSIELTKFLLIKEIKKTDISSTLLRGNTLTTKTLTCFGKLFGNEYFQQVLEGPIKEIIQDSENLNVSIGDIEDEDLLSRNKKNLEEKTRNLINSILSKPELLPKEISEVCFFLRRRVTEKFPEMELSVIGSFVFLRLICPIITTPTFEGMDEEKISNSARKALIQVTKVTQSLSNHSYLGNAQFYKESDEFLKENISSFLHFLGEISQKSFVYDLVANLPLTSKEQALKSVEIIKEIIEDNFKFTQGVIDFINKKEFISQNN